MDGRVDGRQDDLFARGAVVLPAVDEAVIAAARARLVATLVRGRTMPWRDPLRIVREDKAFRADAEVLPDEEGVVHLKCV